MANFDTARKALDTSLNSSGSAMKEHAKWSESLEARLNKLKAAWQGLSQSFMKSDFLKIALDLVIALVDGLTKLIDTIGAIPTALGAFGAFKGISTIISTAGKLNLTGKVTSLRRLILLLARAFPNAVKGVGIFISALKNGKGIVSVLGGALKGLWTIVAAHPILAVVAAVGLIITAFVKWGNKAEELSKKVSELTEKYRQNHEELKKLQGDYDTSNEDSMISRYEKLSKGVDNLGRNVSLTADEYSEYQSIVNQIADQIPSLISGYDEQGNALLSCKGNVEELTAAYEKLIHAQNQEILTNAGNIEDNFNNISEDKGNYSFWEKLFDWENVPIVNWFVDRNTQLDDNIVSKIETLLNDSSADIGWLDGFDYKAIEQAFQAAGINESIGAIEGGEGYLRRVIEKYPKQVKNIIDNYNAQFDEIVQQQKSIAQAKLSEAFDIRSAISGLDYGNISEDLQAVAYQVVGSLDKDFFDKLQADGKTVEQWTTEMLNQLNSIDKEDNTSIEAAFDLQTQFNGGEIPFGDYVKGLEDTGKLIDGLNLKDEVKSQLKLSLGLDEEGIVKEYDRLRKRLASEEYFDIEAKDYESFIEGLSAEELSVVWDVIPKLEKTEFKETIDDVKSALKLEMMKAGLTFDLNLEVETAGIEALNTALAESVSATGLSSESITALKGRYADLEEKGYDLSVLFEETSHGIHLNRQEFNKLEKAYATDKLADVNGDLEEMKVTYDDLGEAIKNTDDPVRKAELYNDRQTLAKRISEAATLAAQYEGLTSAYNDWLAAEEAGQERDMYENVIEGFENIGDEISRGWYDDGTIEFLEMLTGRTDLAGKSAKQLKEIYNGLDKSIKYIGKDGKVLEDTGYSVRDFFTVDDEGNSTADGVYNFLDAIGKLEEEAFGGKDVVKRDKNKKPISFDFELAGGDEAIADALGISKELVQIMKRAADDAGFVVSMDGTYKQLADLQNEARESAEYLKSIGKTDFEFDFNTTNLTDLNKQLKEAKEIWKDPDFWNKDGTFNFDADGATEAMQVISTLKAKIDNLTEEKYGIGLIVEDEEFEEPLENLQEYGRTIQTLNQLELNPEANAEEIEELNGELNEIAEYFANLDKDTKVKLGFEADDGIEEVKKKIQSGEIEIPTVLDIQTNMDKNLETLADLALLNSGFLSEDEEETIRKKYNVEVEADDIDTSDVEEKVDNAVIDGLGNPILSREANIKIIAETFGIEDVDNLSSKLEGLDDKTIQAIAEAVGKGDVDALDLAIEGMDGNTVQAVAEALGYSDVETLKAAVRNMQGNEVDAKVDTDGQAEKIWSLQDEIDGLKGKTVDIVTNIKKVYSTVAAGGKKKAAQRTGMDLSPVNGTANVNGTTGRAYKRGSWGTKNSGTALVGELGREVLVRDGRYYTIGDNGAEFIKYKKGDIIFNHIQSKELFNNGKVTSGGGRAKAFVSGTAFAQGTAFAGGAVDRTETFDWLEVLLTRLERAVNNLAKSADNIHSSWSDREKALYYKDKNGNESGEIVTNRDLISKLQKAVSKEDEDSSKSYWAAANNFDLDSSLKEKVRNGELTPESAGLSDDDAKKISEYKTLWEKYLDAEDKLVGALKTEADLWAQRFDDVITKYDGILQGFEHTESMIDEYISQAEARGHIVSASYYEELIKNNNNNIIPTLESQKSEMITKRDDYVKAMQAQGYSLEDIYDSEQYKNMSADIDGVTLDIEKATTQTIEWQNAIRDLEWSNLDLAREKISNLNSEAEFFVELMSNKDLFDDNGKMTNEGLATMGMYAQKHNTHMYLADDYAAEIADIDRRTQLDSTDEEYLDPLSQDVINRRQELVELQRESILAAEDEKQAIKDLISEGIDKELEALQERIDLHNEELDKMKDFYDYQKQVQEQSEEIAALEKQRAAYLNDTSESGRAKLQEITVSLKEAKENLQETEFDRYISQQEQLLSSLYDEYELVLNERLDNLDGLIEESFATVNNKADVINTTISDVAEGVGVELSNELTDIWSGENGIEGVVTKYYDGFNTSLTSVITTLGTIKDGVNTLAGKSDDEAKEKIEQPKTTTSANIKPASSSSGGSGNGNSSSGGNKSTGDGKPKIGDKVKFLSGKYYYDSQGVNPAGSKNHGKQVYITNINKKKWATHPYHISTGKKLGKGDLGWLKLNQLSGYATGKKNFLDDEIAWTQEKGQEFIIRPSDGAILTPIAKGDSVLTSAASNNIWDMANSPAEFIKDNLNLGVANVPNNSNVQSNYTQHIGSVVFDLKNVKNYEELLSAMQKDKNFERLITSMTIDQIAGKSSLGKGKSIR